MAAYGVYGVGLSGRPSLLITQQGIWVSLSLSLYCVATEPEIESTTYHAYMKYIIIMHNHNAAKMYFKKLGHMLINMIQYEYEWVVGTAYKTRTLLLRASVPPLRWSLSLSVSYTLSHLHLLPTQPHTLTWVNPLCPTVSQRIQLYPTAAYHISMPRKREIAKNMVISRR